MKAFRFKRNRKETKGYEENSFVSNRFNWDRVVYYIVFILVIGSLTIFIFKKSYFISAFGEVITNKFEVKFSDDVKVTKYYVEENQEVSVGDTLLIVRPELSPADSIGYLKTSENNTGYNWLEHELISTKKTINVKKILINKLIAEERYEVSHLKRVREEVYLGLETSGVIAAVESKLLGIRGEKKALREEVKMLNDYVEKLESIENDKSNSIVNVKLVNNNVAYVSPVCGIVNQIYAKENQVTYKQEIAMDLLSFDDVFVSAFVPQKYLNYFNVNDTIGVRFNKNMNSLGVIRSIYFNTAELPAEFRNKYQKITRNIIVRIEPLNDSMKKEWKPFFKMAVQVYQPRIFKNVWIEHKMKKLTERQGHAAKPDQKGRVAKL